MGVTISKSKHLIVPVAVYFLLGVLTTMAEPDLQVLANQVPAIDNIVLIQATSPLLTSGDLEHGFEIFAQEGTGQRSLCSAAEAFLLGI